MNKVLSIYQKNKEIINYLIFGALTTFVSLLSYYLLTIFIFDPNNGIELQITNVLAWIISVTFAYFTNRKFVFNGNNTLNEAVKFYSSRVFTLLIDMFLKFIFVTVLLFNDKIIALLVQVIIIVLNYILSKLIVFKR